MHIHCSGSLLAITLRNALIPTDRFVLLIFLYKNVQKAQVITSFWLSFLLERLSKIIIFLYHLNY